MGAANLLIAQESEPAFPVGPLLVSVGFLLVSAVWVYIDAKSIGARKGLVGGLADNSPLVWAVGTVLMWIVVVPIYLANRGRIQHAAAVIDRPGSQPWAPIDRPDWQHLGWNEAAQASLEHRPLTGGHSTVHPSPHPVGPPAGWYLDPEDERCQRWWDGTAWTEHRTPNAS